MIKGVQTKDKKPLLTIDDIQLYVLELEHENCVLLERYNKEHKQICKAIEIYENSFSTKYKKKRFMEEKTTSDLMYEVLQGVGKDE